MRSSLFLILGIIVIFSCKEQAQVVDINDKVLARVFRDQLLASDLDGFSDPGTSAEDSALLTNSYVEKWVRESLIMQEAEKNIPKNLNIDELVRDYRASLIRHNYEKVLIELQLDSTITQAELNSHYNTSREDYVLKESIVSCEFVKIGNNVPKLEELEDWWKSNDSLQTQRMLEFCDANASFYLLGENRWISTSSLATLLPKGLGKNQLVKGKTVNQSNDGIKYFLRVNDRLETGNIAPLEYIKDRAEKYILHQRKIDILDSKIEELYEQETGRKNVEIFNK